MIRSLYTATSALITLENKQNVITNNMANSNTTGYKSDNLVVKSFNEVMLSNKDTGTKNQVNRLGTINLGSKIDEVNTKFTQGVLKETSKKNNFAIEGRGFFTIEKDGQRLYTRDGDFLVALDGTLSTSDGGKVLGRNLATNNIEPIFVGNDQFTLNSENIITVNNQPKYELYTSDFLEYSNLDKVGNNYYSGENAIDNTVITVKQGFLESSNTSIIEEMTNMMTTMRNFETNQKMIQMLDDTLGKAASEIGNIR